MSTEPAAPAADADKPRRSLPLVPIGAVLAGLIAGGAAGWFGVGPMVATRAFAGGVPAAAGAPAPDESTADTANATPAPQYLIENVIVNPAGSQGTRFVLLTLAIEARDSAGVELMRQRDAELRDAVVHMIGAETVESLSDMARRERLKDDIRARVVALLPAGIVGKLYVPQFVLQ